jgi:Protein of unknown function (DUF3313)
VMTKSQAKRDTSASWGRLTAAILFSALLSACAQTVESKPAVMEGGQLSPAVSGFFGDSYSLLQPGQKGQAAMVYINPAAQWSQYNKILLEPVQFWDSPDTTVSPTDQHMLTAYFYNQLKTYLQKDFTIVDQGGPGVFVLQAGLINATTAVPGLRSISVVIPQARVLNGLQSLATGSYAFVGSAEAEMKVTDSTTGQFLAGAIDKRAGGMALSNAGTFKWGDSENAMDYWAKKINSRLLELQGRAPAAS